jgi:putative oxidoreductase
LLSRFAPLAPLALRLIVGYGFMVHGYAKLSRGPETFAVVLHTLGVPMPSLLAWVTTLVELIGGFAVLIGAFIPIVSLPMAVVLLTALFTVHLPYGFFSVKLVEVTASGTKFGPVGYEVILLYLASLAALVLGGAGPLSMDQWRSSRRARSQDGQ